MPTSSLADTFTGFDPEALGCLPELPSYDPDAYAAASEHLKAGLRGPALALVTDVARALDPDLTVDRRGSVSPLHTDLRFAKPGAPRYKDHLLLTTWQGANKKTAPTLWMRIAGDGVGFASGIGFTPATRTRWREAVGGAAGARLAADLEVVRRRHAKHDVSFAEGATKRVPKPWDEDHPRAELLKRTAFQVRFQVPWPARKVASPSLVSWCAGHLRDLMPIHAWLVAELSEAVPA